MSFRRFGKSLLVLFALFLAYLLWPAYEFVAEDRAFMRKPWAWRDVPDATSCQSSPVGSNWQAVADQACTLLLARQAQLHAPSLSAAIAIEGKLVWSAAVGWADLDKEVLATPHTLYRIGSTSKPVTGTLLARLVDQGVVALDQPIGSYGCQLPNPDWSSLTLRQLASHMAGLPAYENNRDMMGLYHSMALRRHHDDVRQGLALFDGSPQRYKPGSEFEYSSFDTLLIASVLQCAGQRPFESLIHEQMLAPLGLKSPIPDQATPERARFYQLDGHRAQPWRSVDLSNKLPGGGFMSTPQDLVLLGSAWLDKAFIQAGTRDLFWTPQSLASGEINPQSYALTWRWNDEQQYAHHGGVSKGSMAWLAIYPEKSLVIALSINTTLSNFGEFSSVQGELVRLALEQLQVSAN